MQNLQEELETKRIRIRKKYAELKKELNNVELQILDFLIENLDSYAKSLRSPKKNKFGTDKEKKLNCTQTCTICSKLERIQSDFVSKAVKSNTSSTATES